MEGQWITMTPEFFRGPPGQWHPVGLSVDPIHRLAWVGDSPVGGVGSRVYVVDGRAIWVEVDPRPGVATARPPEPAVDVKRRA